MNFRKIAVSVSAVAMLIASMMACSSSSSSGSGSGFSCPSVGATACPKDTPASQSSVDACNRCLKQYQDYTACDPNSSKVNCGADGKSVAGMLSSACSTQLQAVIDCALKTAD